MRWLGPGSNVGEHGGEVALCLTSVQLQLVHLGPAVYTLKCLLLPFYTSLNHLVQVYTCNECLAGLSVSLYSESLYNTSLIALQHLSHSFTTPLSSLYNTSFNECITGLSLERV